MTKLMMLLSLVTASLGWQPITAAAQNVPAYDVRATCRAEAQGDPGAGAVAACMADEQKAREALTAQWAQFTPQNKSSCMQMESGIAGIRSYVELLTCLQIARDVKSLPKE
jgi:hypothetical protein